MSYTYIRVRGSDGSRINRYRTEFFAMIAKNKGNVFVNLPGFCLFIRKCSRLQRGVGTSTNGAGAFWNKV